MDTCKVGDMVVLDKDHDMDIGIVVSTVELGTRQLSFSIRVTESSDAERIGTIVEADCYLAVVDTAVEDAAMMRLMTWQASVMH
jgi:hypothetical protein